ncbi:S1C family serine protease [Demequina salsinemoris]|uniref:S1C family serine protease n=1 Tax=Demequina salsinemoris TaxID=577470 RepID=UPI000782D78A|nr:trypsin-like peptidase domain-containing protein [Demequina salsinemoris]
MDPVPDTRAPRRRALLWSAIGVVALVAVVAVSAFTARWASASAAAEPTASATASASAQADSVTTQDIYETVAPSVVVLETSTATGAGVVVNEDGSILTALSLVEDADEITLTFYDGTTASASIADADTESGTATLTPDALPSVLVPATIGGSASIGDSVIAIGNPLGLEWSVSSGVVSGLDRDVDIADLTASGLIQFDAAVNPGSAGGPLVNEDGQVVGIVVALLTADDDEGFSGIGLAVPVGTALAGDGGEGDGGPQQ